MLHSHPTQTRHLETYELPYAYPFWRGLQRMYFTPTQCQAVSWGKLRLHQVLLRLDPLETAGWKEALSKVIDKFIAKLNCLWGTGDTTFAYQSIVVIPPNSRVLLFPRWSPLVWFQAIRTTVGGKNPAPLRMPEPKTFFYPYYIKTFSGIRSVAGFFPPTVRTSSCRTKVLFPYPVLKVGEPHGKAKVSFWKPFPFRVSGAKKRIESSSKNCCTNPWAILQQAS